MLFAEHNHPVEGRKLRPGQRAPAHLASLRKRTPPYHRLYRAASPFSPEIPLSTV